MEAILSIAESVKQLMERLPQGEPLNVKVFYELGSRSAVQSALKRLVDKEELTNPTRGYYVRPKLLKSVPVKVTTGAIVLARQWAKDNSHILTGTPFEAAYQIGFQTQAPVRTKFWTSGPSRIFRIGHEIVEVIHKGKRLMLKPNAPEGIFYRASLEYASHEINNAHLRSAFKRLSHLSPTVDILTKILKLPINKAWQIRLERFTSELVFEISGSGDCQ